MATAAATASSVLTPAAALGFWAPQRQLRGIPGGDGALFAGPRRSWAPAGRRACALGVRAATVELEAAAPASVPRLQKIYLEKVVPALQEEYKYANAQQIPYVKKIVVNCGVGEAAQNAKSLEATIRDVSLITSQRPVTTRAKKAIAGFKLRQGVPVGVSVTLRGKVMYSFMDRLVNLALPRTRDFQGVNPYSFDGKGNFTLGLREQSVFPEIRFENIDKERGMDVSIINTAKSDTEGQKLLALMGMPFKEGSSATAARAAKAVKSGKKKYGAQKRTGKPSKSGSKKKK